MSIGTPTRSRPQYHYFYGSTGDSSPSSDPVQRPFSPGSSEGETLIGESLVPTDTEDTPPSSEQDLQHLLVTTNGQNGLLPPLIGTSLPSSPQLLHANALRRRPKTRFGRFCQSALCGQKDNTAGHVTRIVLVLLLVLCFLALAVVLSPYDLGNAMGRSETGSRNSSTRSFPYIPFAKVDRINYNDPASNIINLELFDESLIYQGTKDSTRRGIGDAVDPMLKVPFPTGAFWTNLILKPTADRGLSYPVVVYPYAYKWADESLQASYPALHRSVDSLSVRDSFLPDMTFTSSESIVSRHVTKFDPLSVTVRFTLDSGGFWESYLVQGAPYITVKYQRASPVLRALSIFNNFGCPVDSDKNYDDWNFNLTMDASDDTDPDLRKLKWGVCTSSSSSPLGGTNPTADGVTLHGVQFILQTQEGLTWMVFASEPIALTFDNLQKTTVSSADKFTGVLRLALIPTPPGSKKGSSSLSGTVPLSSSSGLRRLIYHSGVYPTGGKVSWDFRTGSSTTSLSSTLKKAVTEAAFGMQKPPENGIGTVKFEFETEVMTDRTTTNSVQDDLLMLSLPHHAQLLKPGVLLNSPSKFDLTFLCIKGTMTPVVGNTWSYDETLTKIGFDDFNVRNYTMDSSVRSAILKSMEVDVNRVLPTLDENIYGFGKQIARLAQLAHIGSVIDQGSTASASSMKHNGTSGALASLSPSASLATQKLHTYLKEYLKSEVSDTLLYDVKFGGVVTRDGLLDSEADFGNGRYNDHHFHYGYMLYACAIMGRLNSTFITVYGSYVDALLFDIAHSANGDSSAVDGSFFPLARHFSWFDGHSFASGLFPFGNGKSQESSSEAVNAYYGAYLWSMVREIHDDSESNLSDFSRLLLAMEIRGAKSYWHMKPPPSTNTSSNASSYRSYEPGFAKNYMVGNLGMLDAVCSTWFGTQSLYVHMINFLPVTAITSQLFDKSYVTDEFKNIIGPLLATAEMAWKGYVICDQAIVDPSAAWTEAQSLVSFELDSAISKSQVLYWISTRKGFVLNATNASKTKLKPSAAPMSHDSTSASCKSHPGCSALSGLCCPTSEGTTLSCCSRGS